MKIYHDNHDYQVYDYQKNENPENKQLEILNVPTKIGTFRKII